MEVKIPKSDKTLKKRLEYERSLFSSVQQDTHRDWTDFEESLSPLQWEVYGHAMDFRGKLWFDLVNIWEDNPDIRYGIQAQANDYWRQFSYNMSFFDLHYGQQLHVLACLYYLTREYIAYSNYNEQQSNIRESSDSSAQGQLVQHES